MTINIHEQPVNIVAYNSLVAQSWCRKDGKIYLKISTTGGAQAYNATDFAMTGPGALDGTQVEPATAVLDLQF